MKQVIKNHKRHIIIGAMIISSGLIGYGIGRKALFSEPLLKEVSDLIDRGIIIGFDKDLNDNIYIVYE